jgi:hypothetical protein
VSGEESRAEFTSNCAISSIARLLCVAEREPLKLILLDDRGERHPMSFANPQSERTSTQRAADPRVELARELFQRFHAQCFWNSPRDMCIDESRIEFVANGLRANGGREGFILGSQAQTEFSITKAVECHWRRSRGRSPAPTSSDKQG